ncbi:MAG: acyl-CoA thioesterase, partial [Massilia sp.]|nr:acyl-CoA thioesterase [Massilia sp.]
MSDKHVPVQVQVQVQVHVMRMPIRWGDMDAMGHVNNTVYFRYFEQARISWFDEVKAAPD